MIKKKKCYRTPRLADSKTQNSKTADSKTPDSRLLSIYLPHLFHYFLLAMSTRLPLFFFFSSRRRHTRCYRDWSSDVCSSDLAGALLLRLPDARGGPPP